MAETSRFELEVRLPARRLSKALVSATHPRLRFNAEIFEKMAEVIGFEPTEGSHPRQFSKLLPSTARPHFRIL